jgi:hypothetical protein
VVLVDIQTPGKYPEESTSYLQHGESLKTTKLFIILVITKNTRNLFQSGVTYTNKQTEKVINKVEESTRWYLVFYYTYDRLNMFQAPLCPSSGARDYTVDYHMGRLVLRLLEVWSRLAGCFGSSLHPGHLAIHPAPNLQQPKNQTAHVEMNGIVVCS